MLNDLKFFVLRTDTLLRESNPPAGKEATMEIKLNRNVDSVARVSSTHPKASRPIDSDSALSAFENSRALEARLEQLPNVRSEKIETGRRLVGDPAYPPRETIKRIATLLAMKDQEVVLE